MLSELKIRPRKEELMTKNEKSEFRKFFNKNRFKKKGEIQIHHFLSSLLPWTNFQL